MGVEVRGWDGRGLAKGLQNFMVDTEMTKVSY